MSQITREQFEAYEEVRTSGVTNMWMTNLVSDLSGLEKDEILEIMKTYGDLTKQYPNVRLLKDIDRETEEILKIEEELNK